MVHLLMDVPWQSAAAEPLIINLYRGEINGLLLEMTRDGLHKTLGEPSAVDDPTAPMENAGSKIHYHEVGISFWLHSRTKICYKNAGLSWSYMSKTWDEKFATWFLPFTGRLSKNVREHWKRQQVEEEFRSFYPKVALPAEGGKALAAQGAGYDTVYIESAKFNVNFLHEKTTKSLERIVLTTDKNATAP